jgi:hypothetical protein
MIPEENYFYVCDGSVLRNLEELVQALPHMPDSVFSYHANREKNDFANWVRDVFGKRLLAKKMSKTTDKRSVAKLVFQEIFS